MKFDDLCMPSRHFHLASVDVEVQEAGRVSTTHSEFHEMHHPDIDLVCVCLDPVQIYQPILLHTQIRLPDHFAINFNTNSPFGALVEFQWITDIQVVGRLLAQYNWTQHRAVVEKSMKTKERISFSISSERSVPGTTLGRGHNDTSLKVKGGLFS
jgi:hypothetical protein